MRPRSLPPAPLWFTALVALAFAYALRLDYQQQLAALGPGDPPPPALAFWGALATVASIIWKGIQIAGEITLKVLSWMVHQLWAFALQIYRFAVDIGEVVWKGFTKAWQYLQLTWEKVLKPAWQQFWKLFDRVKGWVEKYTKPILEFLNTVRKEFLKFYDRFVRPILDIIGIARKITRVLSSLGVDWARALDRRLGELEEAIDKPFRMVLAEINKVINIVNRVVTADGLFQRIALLRSIERDILFVKNQLANAFHRPATKEEEKRASEEIKLLPLKQHIAELRRAVIDEDGPLASRIAEEVADLKKMLRAA